MKKNKPIFSADEKPLFFILSALYGILFFRIFSTFDSFNQLTGNTDLFIYAYAWLFFPVQGIAAAFGIKKLIDKEWPGNTRSLQLLVFSNFALVLLFLDPLFLFADDALFLSSFFVLFHLAAWVAVKIDIRKIVPFRDLSSGLFFMAAILSATWLWRLDIGMFRILRTWSFSNYAFFIGVIAVLYGVTSIRSAKTDRGGNNSAGPEISTYLGTLLLLIFLVVDPRFKVDHFHAAYYLGPLADLAGGKSLLVNINAQYGIFVFYFLKLFFNFIPLGYTSFCAVGTFLTILQYLLLFFICRQLFPSKALSFTALIAVLCVNHFATKLHYPLYYPSIGPLRFGFIYLLMALVVTRNRFPNLNHIIWVLEAAVAATAFFWSYDVCVYTVPAYVGLVLFESVEFQEKTRFDLKGIKKRLLMTVGFMALILGYLYWDVFNRTGEWPQWSYYFDYIFMYQGGLGELPLPAIGYWWILIGILYFSFFSILAICFRPQKPLPANLNAIALLTFYGILQFLYFLFRAHPNNLLHISMPSILLLIFWLYTLRSRKTAFLPDNFRKVIFGSIVVLIGFYSQPAFFAAEKVVKENFLPPSELLTRAASALKDEPREDRFARNAEILMRKYSGDQRSLAYFFDEQGVDVSIYTGRIKLYPYNDIAQTKNCLPALKRVFGFLPPLKDGDYVYFSKKAGNGFESHLLTWLLNHFTVQLIDKRDDVFVWKIRKKT